VLLRVLLLRCLIVVYARQPIGRRLTKVRRVSLLVTQVVGVSTNTERSGGTHSIYPIDTFAGLTYLALFLSTRFKLFVPMGRRRTHTFLFFVSFSPMVVAGFVGATRVSDFQHHGLDVLAGATLGITVALIAYRHWNPWVTDRSAAIPWDVLHMDEIENQPSYDALSTGHPRHESHYTSHHQVRT
jgi:hypothetical protein